MSRSRKKHPGWKDHNQDMKKIANRKARRVWHWDIASGSAYKKLTDRWNICDWNFRYYSEGEVDRAIEKDKRWRTVRGYGGITPKYKYYLK